MKLTAALVLFMALAGFAAASEQCCGCCSLPPPPPPPPPPPSGPGGDDQQYRLTFYAAIDAIENGFDRNSPIVVATHAEGEAFWTPAGMATAGVKLVAETGSPLTLLEELASNDRVASGPGVFLTPGMQAVEVTATADAHYVSTISMLAPSPDWFTGLSGADLKDEAGNWKALDVWWADPIDAGTDSGESWSAADVPTVPQEAIALLASKDYSPAPLLRYPGYWVAEALGSDGEPLEAFQGEDYIGALALNGARCVQNSGYYGRMRDCDPAQPKQQFAVTPSGRLLRKNDLNCMSVRGYNPDGAAVIKNWASVIFVACSTESDGSVRMDQQWELLENGQIKLALFDFCLTEASGDLLKLYQCSHSRTNGWSVLTTTGAAIPAGEDPQLPVMQVSNANGDCWYAAGTIMRVRPCDGSAAQAFHVVQGRVTRASDGRCVDVQGGDSADKNWQTVRMYVCREGRAETQLFNWDSDTGFVHRGLGGRCLIEASGQLVKTHSCDDNEAYAWNLEPLAQPAS